MYDILNGQQGAPNGLEGTWLELQLFAEGGEGDGAGAGEGAGGSGDNSGGGDGTGEGAGGGDTNNNSGGEGGGNKEGDGKDGNSKSDEKPGAPEKYADFTAPEGMEIDKAALEAFTPIAKELNLTQDQAQKLVGLHAEQVQNTIKAMFGEYQQTADDWAEQSTQQYKPEDIQLANRAVKDVLEGKVKQITLDVTPELMKFLITNKTVNHPGVVGSFLRQAKSTQEDSFVSGGGAGGKPKTLGEVLYGDTMK